MFLMPGSRAIKRVTRLGNPASQTQILVDGATIVWDWRFGQIAFITLTASGHTIASPLNFRPGAFSLYIIQDATGSRTVSFGTFFKFPAGVAPVLTTTAGARDLISGICDGTKGSCTYVNNV
jgi:hypothetical protein